MSCLLQRPVICGASVTSGYNSFGVAIRAIAGARLNGKYNNDLYGPADYLAFKYRNPKHVLPYEKLEDLVPQKKPPRTRADVVNSRHRYDGPPYITNVADMVPQLPNHSKCYKQVDALKKSEKSSQLENASIIIGLDGFYWDAVYGECEAAVKGVDFMIAEATCLGIPLVLGTVPQDEAADVDLKLKLKWSEPNTRCVTDINSRIHSKCTKSNNCSIVDFYQMAEDQKNGNFTYEGRKYKKEDLRFDGVHMTELGNKIIMTKIEEALKDVPCSTPNSPSLPSSLPIK